MNKGHRRKSRKSRAAKEAKGGDSRGNGIFMNPIPLHPWTYYPLPPFVIMMPFPVIPFAPMLGPQTQCTNSNSRNVTNTYVLDSYNNNSTYQHTSQGNLIASSIPRC